FLDPTIQYPPGLLDLVRKDFALNARGIYYHQFYKPMFVKSSRSIWIPTLEDLNWNDPREADRRRRARRFAEHNRNNELWKKSEYPWDADAWSDVFGQIRDDPYLTMDKHGYHTFKKKTDAIRCTLTGESKIIHRIPDITFGLATFSDHQSPAFVEQLHQDTLERVLLHPKCGLLADPHWGRTQLAFPFAVYEAKGWDGDCRTARRQACLAAATYLDLLDNLARTPGPKENYEKRVYQTSTSHKYQVFALTSFGAHWHVLVGYRRPRVDNSTTCGTDWWYQEPNEFAGREDMSDTVYVFQRIWSGRIVTEMKAWELLSIVDQIHNWAISEHRAFVLGHLKSWQKF
ncbi:hypothetical protein P152DRAFT_371413, partial [Eremomyces bilateralis CBS 781.70]